MTYFKTIKASTKINTLKFMHNDILLSHVSMCKIKIENNTFNNSRRPKRFSGLCNAPSIQFFKFTKFILFTIFFFKCKLIYYVWGIFLLYKNNILLVHILARHVLTKYFRKEKNPNKCKCKLKIF